MRRKLAAPERLGRAQHTTDGQRPRSKQMSEPTSNDTEVQVPEQSEEQVEKAESPPAENAVQIQPRAGGHKVGLCLELEP